MAHTQNVDEFISELDRMQIGDIAGRPAEVHASAAGQPQSKAPGVVSSGVLQQGSYDPWWQFAGRDPWTGQCQGQAVSQSYFNGAQQQ